MLGVIMLVNVAVLFVLLYTEFHCICLYYANCTFKVSANVNSLSFFLSINLCTLVYIICMSETIPQTFIACFILTTGHKHNFLLLEIYSKLIYIS